MVEVVLPIKAVLLVEAALLVAAVLLAVAGFWPTGSVLYSVIGDGEGGFMGVTALSVLEGDGKCNTAFLLKTVFFLGWLGVFSAPVAKRVIWLSIYLSTY